MIVTRTPRVSIILPTFNAGKYIVLALQSVFQQTCTDYEVIVVDDGSTDETAAIVRKMPGRVRYVYHSNKGPSGARNTGIALAKAGLICFLDADDTWTPGKLHAQLEFMDRNPHIGMVFSDEEEFDEKGVVCRSLLSKSRLLGEYISGSPIKNAFQKLLQENFVPTSMVMIRRECFDTAGLFDVDLKSAEDRDMWCRIAAYYPIAYLSGMLGRKRVVSTSVSRDVETTLRCRILAWNKAGRLFPDLAPAATINALLAPTYAQLGFVLVGKGKMTDARWAARESLKVSHDLQQLFVCIRLIVVSLVGKRVGDAVSWAKRFLALGNRARRATGHRQPSL